MTTSSHQWLRLLTACSLLYTTDWTPSTLDIAPTPTSRWLGWMPEKLALRLQVMRDDMCGGRCWLLWKLRLRTTGCWPCMYWSNEKFNNVLRFVFIVGASNFRKARSTVWICVGEVQQFRMRIRLSSTVGSSMKIRFSYNIFLNCS